MKTINKVIENLQLLKKLEPLLENMDVEFIACIDWEDNWQCSWHTTRIVKSDTKNIETYDWWDMCQSGTDFYKTLTLEEAIEFLPKKINNYYFVSWKNEDWYWCNYLEKDEDELFILDNSLLVHIFGKKTLLEAIEKMLEYLLNNKLLTK